MIDVEKTVAQWVVAGDIHEDDATPITLLLKVATMNMTPAEADKVIAQYIKSWRSLATLTPEQYAKKKKEFAKADRRFKKRLDEFNREGPEAVWSGDLKKLRAFHEKNWPERTWSDDELLANAKSYRDRFKVKRGPP
jgi:hypothetical protein